MISWVNSKLTLRVVHSKVMKKDLSDSGYCYQQAAHKNYNMDNRRLAADANESNTRKKKLLQRLSWAL